MNQVERNVAVVRGIYEAFGRGDVPAILERMSESVEWELGAKDIGVPWLRPGRGRAAVGAFFEAVGANLDFRDFRVLAVMGEGAWVTAIVHVDAKVKPTGKSILEPYEVHVWRVDERGQVDGFRHAADTLQHVRAAS